MINIDDLLGVPYKNHGRNKDGYDCYGLVLEVEKRFGHILPDIDDMKCSEALRNFDKLHSETIKLLNVCEITEPLQESDVILFKGTSNTLNHIGVYLGDNNFIHCNKYGVHIEKLDKWNIGKVYTWQ